VRSRPEPVTDVSYAVACRRSVRWRVLERTLDMTLSACVLVLLAPLWAIVAVAIRLDSRGPVFYRQRRRGEGDRTFLIFKFRTMTVDADARLAEVLDLNMHAAELADPRMYKIPNDPRVTCFGALLRRYSLDEFPQLLNVLRGEMSLVGPRPLMLMEDRHVSGPGTMRRTVKPGLTGPWQVSGRNEISFEKMLRLDCAYVRDRSVLGDLRLILKTVPLLVRAQRPC
jgi:lipopolysaccharide/colanic/teichoic acid biosynthesis glycosyltransferase